MGALDNQVAIVTGAARGVGGRSRDLLQGRVLLTDVSRQGRRRPKSSPRAASPTST
jgi:hypothetical protein